MPTALPRISVVVEPPVFRVVSDLAKKAGVTLSQKTRDLLLEALELCEDESLEAIAAQRRRNRAPSIPHGRFWAKRGLK